MLRSGNRNKSEEHRTEHRRTKVINYQNKNQQKNAVRERERELFKGMKSSCWFSGGVGLAAPPAASTWEMLPLTCADSSLLERKYPFQRIQSAGGQH